MQWLPAELPAFARVSAESTGVAEEAVWQYQLRVATIRTAALAHPALRPSGAMAVAVGGRQVPVVLHTWEVQLRRRMSVRRRACLGERLDLPPRRAPPHRIL